MLHGRSLVHFLAALAFCMSPVAVADTLRPIADLGSDFYQGYQGGLYPGGSNAIPPQHLALALDQAWHIQPRAGDGQPDPLGWIGFVAIGMSNTAQEFKVLDWLLADAAEVHPALRVVNGAQGGMPAEALADPGHVYWDRLGSRIAASGLTPEQVQVCWLKQAQGQVEDPTFPNHVQLLEQHLADILRNLRQVFPQLRVCYLTNRIYGGYTDRVERGEPLTYESGFAVKAVIERQIQGAPALNADPAAGDVVAPVVLWGSEQWANGADPRADGLTWLLQDYEDDRVHPSLSGEIKAGTRWFNALRADAVAQRWLFARWPGQYRVSVEPVADSAVNEADPDNNYGNAPELRAGWVNGGNDEVMSYLRFQAGPLNSAALMGSRLFVHTLNPIDFEVWPVLGEPWQETSLTWNQRPALGASPLTGGHIWESDSSTAYNLGTSPGISADGDLNIALRRTPGQSLQRVSSRHSPLSPWLVLRLKDQDWLFSSRFDDPPSGD